MCVADAVYRTGACVRNSSATDLLEQVLPRLSRLLFEPRPDERHQGGAVNGVGLLRVRHVDHLRAWSTGAGLALRVLPALCRVGGLQGECNQLQVTTLGRVAVLVALWRTVCKQRSARHANTTLSLLSTKRDPPAAPRPCPAGMAAAAAGRLPSPTRAASPPAVRW